MIFFVLSILLQIISARTLTTLFRPDQKIHKGMEDNTYEGTFGTQGYGYLANEKLKTVRGKDFRHEKTKKKRGSYRGGLIDTNVVNSVAFDNSSDEE